MKFKKFVSEENLVAEFDPTPTEERARMLLCEGFLTEVFEGIEPRPWFARLETDDPYAHLDLRVRQAQELALKAIISLLDEGVVVEIGGKLLLSPSQATLQKAMDIAGVWYVGSGFKIPEGRKAYTLSETAELAIEERGFEEFCEGLARDFITRKEFGIAPTPGEKGN